MNASRLYHLGIMNGKSETKFYPYDPITREELAVIAARIYRLVSSEENAESEALPEEIAFTDSADISDWAKYNVSFMSKLGIMIGDQNCNFRPKDLATKEQSVAVLVRLYELFGDFKDK